MAVDLLPDWARKALSNTAKPNYGDWSAASYPNAPGGMSDDQMNYYRVLDQYQQSLPDTSGLQNSFMSQLQASLSNPGLSDKEVESIINKGTDEINESERAGGRNLMEQSLAAGGGNLGGDYSAGLRDHQSAYAGQRAGLARDVRTDAAKQRDASRMQALGAAGSYLGQQQQQRNKMLDFMSQGAGGKSGGGGGGAGLQVIGHGWTSMNDADRKAAGVGPGNRRVSPFNNNG